MGGVRPVLQIDDRGVETRLTLDRGRLDRVFCGAKRLFEALLADRRYHLESPRGETWREAGSAFLGGVEHQQSAPLHGGDQRGPLLRHILRADHRQRDFEPEPAAASDFAVGADTALH